MTKLEALQKSKAMWEFLDEYPDKLKHDYLSMVKTERPINGCYICEFMFHNTGACPGDCIIDWGDDSPYSCEYEDSPYDDWLQASTEAEHKIYAEQIVDLHNAAIAADILFQKGYR